MKNPGALAGATGAEWKADSLQVSGYLDRLARATALEVAIRDADPVDAAVIMSSALLRFMAGAPAVPLLTAMDEAISWADGATPDERKAYCLASFNAMPPSDRAGFLAYVQGRDA